MYFFPDLTNADMVLGWMHRGCYTVECINIMQGNAICKVVICLVLSRHTLSEFFCSDFVVLLHVIKGCLEFITEGLFAPMQCLS